MEKEEGLKRYRVLYRYGMCGYLETKAECRQQARDLLYKALYEDLNVEDKELVLFGPEEYVDQEVKITDIIELEEKKK